MTIGGAIHVLQNGGRVAREAWVTHWTPLGWVPWLVLVPGSRIAVDPARPLGQAAPELAGREVDYMPHIDIVTDHGTRMQPWLPTHADLLADDWGPVT